MHIGLAPRLLRKPEAGIFRIPTFFSRLDSLFANISWSLVTLT